MCQLIFAESSRSHFISRQRTTSGPTPSSSTHERLSGWGKSDYASHNLGWKDDYSMITRCINQACIVIVFARLTSAVRNGGSHAIKIILPVLSISKSYQRLSESLISINWLLRNISWWGGPLRKGNPDDKVVHIIIYWLKPELDWHWILTSIYDSLFHVIGYYPRVES
jgi:hypothetical protein